MVLGGLAPPAADQAGLHGGGRRTTLGRNTGGRQLIAEPLDGALKKRATLPDLLLVTKSVAQTQTISWIRASGQTRKLVCFVLMLGASGLCFAGLVLAVRGVSPFRETQELWFAGLQIALGAVAMALLVAIRCPRCRGRVAWHFISSRDFADWFTEFLSSSACPLCGHVPVSAVQQAAAADRAQLDSIDPW